MKKYFSNTIRLLSITGSLILATSFYAHSAEFVSVTKDGANVRTGPSTDKPVYMELFKGYPLKVIERKGEWIKITDFEKDGGWVHSSLTEKGNLEIERLRQRIPPDSC